MKPGTLVALRSHTDFLGVVCHPNTYTRAGEVAVKWDQLPDIHNIPIDRVITQESET